MRRLDACSLFDFLPTRHAVAALQCDAVMECVLPSFCTSMIFVAQAFRYNLEELLRVLLLPANARTKSVLECAYEGLRRDGLLVYGPLVQLVEDIFEAICEQTLLQTLQLPGLVVAFSSLDLSGSTR